MIIAVLKGFVIRGAYLRRPRRGCEREMNVERSSIPSLWQATHVELESCVPLLFVAPLFPKSYFIRNAIRVFQYLLTILD
jgi:hypothetical protein